MSLMRDESFGPIIGVQKVSGAEEALPLMQDTEYGLTAGVFSASRAVATQITDAIEALCRVAPPARSLLSASFR